MFVKLSNNNTAEKYPVTIEEINELHPSLSGLDDNNLRNVGYERLVYLPFDGKENNYKKTAINTVERDEGTGVWLASLKLVNRFSSEEEALSAINQKLSEIRNTRNNLLLKADNALTRSTELEFLGYNSDTNPLVIPRNKLREIFAWKQELRDITSQLNYWDIRWPNTPDGLVL